MSRLEFKKFMLLADTCMQDDDSIEEKYAAPKPRSEGSSTLGWRVFNQLKTDFSIEAKRRGFTSEEAIDQAMRIWLGRPPREDNRLIHDAFDRFFWKPRSDSDKIMRDAIKRLLETQYNLK